MPYDPPSNQSSTPKSRQRRRSEDAAVLFLKNARLGFSPADLVTAIRRIRAARRPLLEARAIIRMAEQAKAGSADRETELAVEPEPKPELTPRRRPGWQGAEHCRMIVALFDAGGAFHGSTATTEQIASRIGGLARSYVAALLVGMPEAESVDGRWSVRCKSGSTPNLEGGVR